MRRLALAVGLLAGCARMAPPPGGPPDGTPPILLSTLPDSVRVLEDFDDWVEFRFDEVISEGTQPNFGFGNGELEKLILLSPAPDSVVPRVQWRRDRLRVRPRDGWLPNTTYRIELAPGIRDIREPSNASTTASVVTFATGGPLPTRYIVGRAVDWTGPRPAPLALVEALLLPDSLPYRTLADSNGRFAFGPLPQGEFLVRVALDQNRNRRLEAAEPWDTVRLPAGRDLVGEIWAFPRDSAPPRIQSAERVDSFTIGLVLSKTLDPGFSLPADSIRVLGLPDSGTVGPIGALPQPAHDSLYRGRGGITPVRPAGDTLGAQPGDSAPPAARAARPSGARAAATGTPPADTLEQKRPPLTNRLNIRTTGILQLGTSYLIEVRGVRSIGKGRSDVLRIRLDTPKPPPVDTTKARADSLARRADSLARRPLR